MTIINNNPVISCDSGQVLELDSKNNYEPNEISQGIDQSAMHVTATDKYVTVAFNNEIKVMSPQFNVIKSIMVNENVADCITHDNLLIYSTYDGYIQSLDLLS